MAEPGTPFVIVTIKERLKVVAVPSSSVLAGVTTGRNTGSSMRTSKSMMPLKVALPQNQSFAVNVRRTLWSPSGTSTPCHTGSPSFIDSIVLNTSTPSTLIVKGLLTPEYFEYKKEMNVGPLTSVSAHVTPMSGAG